jgi:hypothetical protein
MIIVLSKIKKNKDKKSMAVIWEREKREKRRNRYFLYFSKRNIRVKKLY